MWLFSTLVFAFSFLAHGQATDPDTLQDEFFSKIKGSWGSSCLLDETNNISGFSHLTVLQPGVAEMGGQAFEGRGCSGKLIPTNPKKFYYQVTEKSSDGTYLLNCMLNDGEWQSAYKFNADNTMFEVRVLDGQSSSHLTTLYRQ